MVVSLTLGNCATAVAVVFLPIGCWVLIAPMLIRKHLVFFSVIWGLPFAIGQFSQSGKWGWIWVQYHLLDFSYGPWATVCGLSALAALIRWRRWEISMRWPAVFSFSIVMSFALLSEIHDSVRDWTLDWGDYLAFSLGGTITVAFYKLFKESLFSQTVTS